VDGGGYLLHGSGAPMSIGIDLTERSNVTIKNIRISLFYYGIRLYRSSNNSITGNNITANNWYGIYLEYSSNNIITGNNIANNGGGIYLYYSSNNSITGNNIANNWYGIGLGGSSNNSITGNNITANNQYGIWLEYSSNNSIVGNTFINDGLSVQESYHNFVKDNTVNGKPLVYLEGEADHSISDAGQVILVSCNRIRVENLNLSKTSVGIQLLKTNDSIITGNNIANNWYGIGLGGSSNNIITGNNITANNWYGIWLYRSSNSIITGNNIANNGDGIYLYYSSNNSITGNNITANNWDGIYLYYSSNNSITGNNITANNRDGICLGYSSNNSITVNNITANNWDGIRLYDSSNDNIITGNNIAANNWRGINLEYSSNNSIFHNNFVDNAREVYSYISVNVWDDGYPSGGNYWSDCAGVDLFGGPYQNMTGGDGIGDTPYIIDANNQDMYPLMAPFSTFEAGVWDGTAYNVDVLSNSTVSDFKFDVDNKSISLKVTGDNGTVGFCRVAIPKSLLWADDGWTIFVDNQPITDYTKLEDENNTYLYFTYTHSTKTVTIRGTHVIPEYPLTLILALFMATTLIAVVVLKTKRKRQFP
jgi:parallel beta-helix repeat protein